MKRPINYTDHAGEGIETMSRGAFLTVANGDNVNTMTIAWGSIGFIWGRPIFMAMVRPSRFTHELLDASGEFSVSIPFSDLSKQLAYCGSHSGREGDKLAAAGLQQLAGEVIAAPVLDTPGLHYECKVTCRQEMLPSGTDAEVAAKWYANGDFHTLYFGEIVASYRID